MKIKHNTGVRGLQIINHLLLVYGFYYAIANELYNLLIISLLVYWTIGVLGINIGFHRLISHRSFQTNIYLEKLFSLIGVITTVGSPIAWSAIHRRHHQVTDTDSDPHSPHLLGKFKAWFGFWNYQTLSSKLVKDLRKNNWYKQLHKYYFVIILCYCFILYAIDPIYLIYVYAIPACLCLHSSSAIIVIAHLHGYKNHELKDDKAKNSWIANIITLGEGWHNNHHANPRAWSNWEKWWEWDIPALIIKAIKK
jgi:fatty-acid desaturase